MATTAQWYGQAPGLIMSARWLAQDLRAILMKNTYVPDTDNHLRYTDISAQELAAGGGYTVGGKSFTAKAASYDAAANEMNLQGADISWGPGATFTVRYAVIYEADTTDKFLWGLVDFGADQPVASGTFTLDWATNILAVSQGPAV